MSIPEAKPPAPVPIVRGTALILLVGTALTLAGLLPGVFERLGSWQPHPLVYLLAYVGATVLALPATALTLAAGAWFGVGAGSLWTWLGATLGAMAAFAVARWLAADWVQQQLQGRGDRLAQFSQGIAERGFWFVLSVRLAPIFPFNFTNYALGLTPVPSRDYLLATAIGIVPGTVVYSWLGAAGRSALTGETRWPLLAALLALAALSALPLWLRPKS
ncbi:MAG: TVP38/TMEM64 family protein [Oscillatoriales cyanobacterium SM2_1_8]|nr:TVP38/TMEM64 family protein [Oscillatoriales cyanobacterium SM2_1_8]